MDDRSSLLGLPFVMPAQAQKHVTHNEAIRALDALVQLSVKSRSLSAPPQSPAEGDRYIIGSDPTESWSDREGRIAAWQDGAWAFFKPQSGWLAYCEAESALLMSDGADWSSPTLDINESPAKFGINTDADTTNRFALKSDAALLSHDDVTPGSGDIRISLNKAGPDKTASLIFQDNYAARAEMGLSGEDNFSFKVSPDGSTFQTALKVDAQTGRVEFPQGLSGSAQLSGYPQGGLSGYDHYFVDPANGNDSHNGRSLAQAWKSLDSLENELTIGRRTLIDIAGDILWNRYVTINFPISNLTFRGITADGTGYINRKIVVTDSVNVSGYPGLLNFNCPAHLYFYKIDIELASSSAYPFLFFDSTSGYIKTTDMTLSKTGTGSGTVFGLQRSFIPSQHDNLTITPGASGHMASGVSSGSDPNAHWNYPSNVTAF